MTRISSKSRLTWMIMKAMTSRRKCLLSVETGSERRCDDKA